MNRPLCECHGEPQHRNGVRLNGTQKWCCSVKACAKASEHYDALDGVAYNRKLLLMRRRKALARRARRKEG